MSDYPSITWTQTHREREERLHESLRTGCQGTFRVTESDGKRPATIECETCGALEAITQAVLAGGATPTQTSIPQPDIPF